MNARPLPVAGVILLTGITTFHETIFHDFIDDTSDRC